MTISFNKHWNTIEIELQEQYLSAGPSSRIEDKSKRTLAAIPTKIDAVSERLEESIAQQTDSHAKRHPAGFIAGGFRAFLCALAVDRIK